MRADKRYYTNASRSKIVDEDSPEAAYLLAAEGDDILNEDVKRYGLNKPKPAPEPEAAEEAAEKPSDEPEVKAVEKAPENKAQKQGEKK